MAVAIGNNSNAKGQYSIAIGNDATTAYTGGKEGSGGVAIGTGARSSGNGLALGRASQAIDNCIVLNSSASYISPTPANDGFFVNPIRKFTSYDDTYYTVLQYNNTSKEVYRTTSFFVGKPGMGTDGFVTAAPNST